MLLGQETVGEVCDIAFDAPLWEIFDEKLKDTGYTYENYEVTSEDGYILSLVRLVQDGESDEDRAVRPPVLFQHGIAMTAENWLTITEDTSQTATVLQALERGYDVWLSNSRGTRYSLGHTSLDAKVDTEYWDFSFDKMG